MTRRFILAVVAVAASACAPLRLEPTNAGFGNAFQALFEGFKRAARCGARLELVDGANRKEKSRYRRICDRLTCAGASFVPAKSHPGEALSVSFKNALLPVGCPAGCAKRRMPRETRILRPAFEAANGGRWLAALTCVGPNAAKRAAAGATRPFTTAAHIRSIRYDFERPPERVKKDRRGRHPANISLDENAQAEWDWLATSVYRGGAVFISAQLKFRRFVTPSTRCLLDGVRAGLHRLRQRPGEGQTRAPYRRAQSHGVLHWSGRPRPLVVPP